FETITDVRNDLILTTRWPLLLAVVAVIGAGRLAYTVIIEPRLSRRALRPPAPTQAWHLRGPDGLPRLRSDSSSPIPPSSSQQAGSAAPSSGSIILESRS